VSYSPRPHVSPALAHLRFGVTAAALVLGLCLVAQITVWALVHFTEVRTEKIIEKAAPSGPLTIVRRAQNEPPPEPQPQGPTATRSGSQLTIQSAPPPAPMVESKAPDITLTKVNPNAADVNLVPTSGEFLLQKVARFVQSIGIVAAIALAVLAIQGAVVAGGGAVPGVDKAVGASTWALVVALLTLPLARLIPEFPLHGVFRPYAEVVADSAAYRAGGPGAPGAIAYFGAHIILPAMLALATLVIVFRFRAGVEEGIIVTSASQLDEKLEREIRSLKLGQLSSPRAVGAFNAAIGEMPHNGPAISPAPAPAPPEPVAAGAESYRRPI